MRHMLHGADAVQECRYFIPVVQVTDAHKAIVLQHGVVVILVVRAGNLLPCNMFPIAINELAVEYMCL